MKIPLTSEEKCQQQKNLDLLCFLIPIGMWEIRASAVGDCVCPLVVVVGLTFDGTSLCGSSLDQNLDDVLALAREAGNRRIGVQNSSDGQVHQHDGR